MLLYIIFFVFSIWQWIKNRKALSLMFLIFSLCSCFRLIDLSMIGIKVTDYALVYVLCILACSYRKIRLKSDKVGVIILSLLFYCTLNFLFTIFFTPEEPLLAFQAYRTRLLLLMYFIIRQLDADEAFQTLKYTMGIVLLSTLLYILQPLGINLYQGGQNETIYLGEMTRYRNAPNYIHFFIIWLLFSNVKMPNTRKYIYLFLLICGLILPMSRTPIFTLGFVVLLYLIYSGKHKLSFNIISICLITYALFGSYFEYRMNSTDTTTDFLSVFQMRSYEDFDWSGGTFQFRIAMLLERLDYLMESNNWLFGVGFPHELSTYTRSHFNFILGTVAIIDGSAHIGYLETPDISWVTLLMRLGFVGLFIYFCLLWQIGRQLFKSQTKVGTCTLLWMASLVLMSFSGDVIGMSAFNNYCLLFILYTYTMRVNKIKSYDESQK